MKNAWNLEGDLKDEPSKVLTGQLFRSALAIMHSPRYESDHQEALAQDWAHLPIPKDFGTFQALVTLGDKIGTLLDPLADADPLVEGVLSKKVARTLGVIMKLPKAPVAQEDLAVTVSYFGAAKGKWQGRPFSASEKGLPAWGDGTGDLYINEHVLFCNVPERVWQYELGGYPLLKKWLGYRHSGSSSERKLSLAEAHHFRSMIQRIAALLTLHDEMDRRYELATSQAFTAEELGLRS